MSLLTGSPVRGGVWRASPELSWSSLVTRHRSWVAAAFAVCGLFGLGVTLVSSDHLHRMWGLMAACGYGLATVAVLTWRSRGADRAAGLDGGHRPGSARGVRDHPLGRTAGAPRHPV